MILQVLADAGKVRKHRNAQRREKRDGTDT